MICIHCGKDEEARPALSTEGFYHWCCNCNQRTYQIWDEFGNVTDSPIPPKETNLPQKEGRKEMRKYLTKPDFEQFVTKECALYIDEDGDAIFRAPPGLGEYDAKDEDYRAGILMTPEGHLRVGMINLDCDNWEETDGCNYTSEEAEWIGTKLLRLAKYKGL